MSLLLRPLSLLPRVAFAARGGAAASAPLPLLRSSAAPQLLLRRTKWTASTYRPPKPPPEPPKPKERLVVLHPRQGSHMTTLEVKRRVLRSSPHMGAKRLKKMVRLHARQGNRNSFIADLESRLDRFLYRSNAVNSTFAARMLVGHRHVMVNGRIMNSTHYILKPGDIVEPSKGPQSLGVWKRMMKRRLANNTFVIVRPDGTVIGSPTTRARAPERSERSKAVTADLDALLRDSALLRESYRRLPLPGGGAAGGGGGSSSLASGARWPAARQAELDTIVPSLLSALAGEGTPLASALRAGRPEIRVLAPPQRPGGAPTKAVVAWQPGASGEAGVEEGPKVLMTLDRIRLRRLLLGLLALHPARGSSQ